VANLAFGFGLLRRSLFRDDLLVVGLANRTPDWGPMYSSHALYLAVNSGLVVCLLMATTDSAA
jgi:hypothetical protein